MERTDHAEATVQEKVGIVALRVALEMLLSVSTLR